MAQISIDEGVDLISFAGDYLDMLVMSYFNTYSQVKGLLIGVNGTTHQ